MFIFGSPRRPQKTLWSPKKPAPTEVSNTVASSTVAASTESFSIQSLGIESPSIISTEAPSAVALSAVANQRSFPFLRLPPELRNQIYALVFQEVSVRRVRRAKSTASSSIYICNAPGQCLLYACRQLNRESRSFRNSCTTITLFGLRCSVVPVGALQRMLGQRYCQGLRIMTISETIAKEWYLRPNRSGWGYPTILRIIFPALERIVVPSMLTWDRRLLLEYRFQFRLQFGHPDLEVVCE